MIFFPRDNTSLSGNFLKRPKKFMNVTSIHLGNKFQDAVRSSEQPVTRRSVGLLSAVADIGKPRSYESVVGCRFLQGARKHPGRPGPPYLPSPWWRRLLVTRHWFGETVPGETAAFSGEASDGHGEQTSHEVPMHRRAVEVSHSGAALLLSVFIRGHFQGFSLLL